MTARGQEKFIKELDEEVPVTVIRNERVHRGRLRRSIDIPFTADQQRVETKYTNGLLTVTFQKRSVRETCIYL